MWVSGGRLEAVLIPLTFWLLLSGLDDLFITAVWLAGRRRAFPWPSEPELERTPESRIAILTPLWREHRVIGRMLERNLAAIRYANYDIFIGVYPNDPLTRRAVEEAAARNPRVHLALCPHDGPTSKGDCLNHAWRQMQAHEARRRVRYEVIVTHDAEDVVHPESLRLINWFCREFDMVQVPVLPLATPASQFTHGVYCDEFAEYQMKDIPVRQRLGGFLPSNGVGTGFRRAALERLAAARGGRVFDPESLTEDYDTGYRLHAMGCRQMFVPVRFTAGAPSATREYFPRRLRAAVRQRSRWVAGIVLQGWQRHGWRTNWRQRYWLWRDRKGLIGNLLSSATTLLLLGGAVGWGAGRPFLGHMPGWLAVAGGVAAAMGAAQAIVRATCCARIYGWRMAVLAPVRVFWANQINAAATASALWQFLRARIRRAAMEWWKTDHAYPARPDTAQARPRLGEVLVRMRRLSLQDVEDALRERPRGLRLGERLVLARKLTEHELYEALGAQAGIPVGRPPARQISRSAARVLPAEAVRRWRALPYRVSMGELHVLTTEVPTEEMARELGSLSTLEIRFRLAPPRDFEAVEAECFGPNHSS